MPVQLLPVGSPILLIQNQVYALPAVHGSLFCSVPAAVVQASNDITFTNFANAFVFSEAGVTECSGTFIRATTPNAVVIFKRM